MKTIYPRQDQKPLKNRFASDDEILKTASAGITRWTIALMVFNFELKCTPGEQIPHAVALTRIDFVDDESDNDRVCFAVNNIIAQSNLVTQTQIITEHETNRLFPRGIETNQKRQLETMFRSGKKIQSTKRWTDHTKLNHLQRCCSIHSTRTAELGFVKRAWDTSWEECNWGIGQIDKVVALHYPKLYSICSKWKKFRMNRPCLRKTVSSRPEVNVWERLQMDCDYVRDQSNDLYFVDAGSSWTEALPARNSTTETVKVSLCQIFARFEIPETLLSDNGPEFVSDDIKQWSELQGI